MAKRFTLLICTVCFLFIMSVVRIPEEEDGLIAILFAAVEFCLEIVKSDTLVQLSFDCFMSVIYVAQRG
jgi:hypothetical protein